MAWVGIDWKGFLGSYIKKEQRGEKENTVNERVPCSKTWVSYSSPISRGVSGSTLLL